MREPKKGISPKDDLDEIKEGHDELLTDYKEKLEGADSKGDRDYYQEQLSSVKMFIERADKLISDSESILGQQIPAM